MYRAMSDVCVIIVLNQVLGIVESPRTFKSNTVFTDPTLAKPGPGFSMTGYYDILSSFASILLLQTPR